MNKLREEGKILKDVLRGSNLLDTHNYQECEPKYFSWSVFVADCGKRQESE